MGTYTSNYNLYMPTVGETGWGTLVNGNFTTIDTTMKGLDTRITPIIMLKTVVDTYAELSELTNLKTGDKVFCWEYVSDLPRIYTWNGSSWTAKANGEVPQSYVEYFRLDKGYKISFYQIQADSSNMYAFIYHRYYGSNNTNGRGGDAISDNVILLPKNCYIIGTISAYYSSYSPDSFKCVIRYKNLTSNVTEIALTTTNTTYVVPSKTNGIDFYLQLGYKGAGASAYVYGGFTAVE